MLLSESLLSETVCRNWHPCVMRRFHAIPLCIACSIAGFVAISRNSVSAPDSTGSGLTDDYFTSAVSEPFSGYREEGGHSVELILDVEGYEDPDFGFSVAIPAGWRRIVIAEPEAKVVRDELSEVEKGSTLSKGLSPGVDLPVLEPGYAVGFESAHRHENDQFADYILVEILPGKSSGLFAADVNHRQSILIDGRPAWYDRLEINQSSTGLTDVDLVIYQAELAGVGYTVGLYAIGELASERTMAIAFEIMLQTFKVDRPPFSVS